MILFSENKINSFVSYFIKNNYRKFLNYAENYFLCEQTIQKIKLNANNS